MTFLGTRSLLLTVDGTECTDSVSKAVITSTKAGVRLLGRAEAERTYKLAIIAAQDAAPGSLWDLTWSRSGEQVTFYLAPYGNAEASDLLPHYSGTVVIAQPEGDYLGTAANPSLSQVQAVEMTWQVVGKPDRITSGTYPSPLPAGW